MSGRGSPLRLRLEPDTLSVRSLTSIGLGSTDGKKLTIRRVPTCPSHLLHLALPSSPGEECSSEGSSWCGSDSGSDHRRRGGALPRDLWPSKLQFILACVGYSVGLGNLWRFPYLCYTSGGGVFLIPYYTVLLVCGVPLLYMEQAVGQFSRRGPIGALAQLCPLLKGAGISSVVVSVLMSTYSGAIIAYALFYLFTAFKGGLPWTQCSHRWNSDRCWHPGLTNDTHPPPGAQSPTQQFFERKVLQVSGDIGEVGGLRWELAACLVFAWVLVYFALWKSVRSSGRVLTFTATFPFLLVLAFLARALTLQGAHLGLTYLFTPELSRLAQPEVWTAGAGQALYSMGIAFGSVISLASYNKASNKILIDTATVSLINGVTSLAVGSLAFATLGNLAYEQQADVQDLLSHSPGLVFVVYPQAISKMPASSLWAVLFYFMLLCLGLNSQMAIVEVVVTSVQDGFPNWIRKRLICHEVLVLVVCCISFCLGLPHITQGGIYYFKLVDDYAVSRVLAVVALTESVAVTWLYGSGRLASGVSGWAPLLGAAALAPLLLGCLVLWGAATGAPPPYPPWALHTGRTLTALCLLPIPVAAICVLISTKADTFLERLKKSVEPHVEEEKPREEDKGEHDIKELAALLDSKLPIELAFRLDSPQPPTLKR